MNNTLFFGLPGNPVAVMVTFYQFVQPALHFLASGESHVPLTLNVRCSQDLRKRPGRTEFLRGILQQSDNAELHVAAAGKQGSGILSSMSQANCFIVLGEDHGDIEAGSLVPVQPFKCFV